MVCKVIKLYICKRINKCMREGCDSYGIFVKNKVVNNCL